MRKVGAKKARFLGPIRATILLVAGVMEMRLSPASPDWRSLATPNCPAPLFPGPLLQDGLSSTTDFLSAPVRTGRERLQAQGAARRGAYAS